MRRDFHHFAESGWVEFRTAKVAEILTAGLRTGDGA
jgi:metal-dependent amidase/aminoacylase/carboxypeptidase family protein